MNNDIPSAYDPKSVEDEMYKLWTDKKCFDVEPDASKKPFVILMPPPNVTGVLHLGHALDATIQDILIRYKRMQGYNSCWIPGTDHASIATEAKVVASLAKDGITKFELGREGFLEKAWEWKEEYGGAIIDQLKKMGASPDWRRERFTMDDTCSKAVRHVFVELYNKGLIYKGNRMVNWCPTCNTSISDVEVEHEESQGKLWHLKYPFADGTGHIIVATTRPETMLGDTAVAVNPEDDRYKNVIGKMIKLPITGREIPVIADSYADPAFGSGAVKVTPSHDPNDFEIGLRHNLPHVIVIGHDGKMTKEAGDFCGMDRNAARVAIVKKLEEEGALVRIEDHLNQVGHCQRCGDVAEPLTSDQWFVRMEELAKPAIEEVKSGKIRFVPERFQKTYLNWMENVRDWCISRQLWWGHRIPVWYCADCGEMFVSLEDPTECVKCGSKTIKQDEDVLDTWFSSGIWPFSTLGWPEDTKELNTWYPTSVLVTGYDIIFFWVARMIFMSLDFMKDKPFSDVLLHGLIRNADGSKMSKSKGNAVNPLEIIEQYGADTLRFTLVTGNTPGNDIKWNTEKVEASRNFCNKIWNASRFVMMNLEGFDPFGVKIEEIELQMADKWIISRLNRLIGDMNSHIERYDLGEASRSIYEFIWGEYCDWYIEMVKPRLYGREDEVSKQTACYVLWKVLDSALKMLHPFMPFITEGIWQHLPHEGEAIMQELQPVVNDSFMDDSIEEQMNMMQELVRSIRNVRAEFSVAPSRKIEAIIHASPDTIENIKSVEKLVVHLAGIENLVIEPTGEKRPEKAAVAVMSGAEVFLPLAGLIDLDKEIERLKRECDKLNAEYDKVSAKLNNESFVKQAPEAVVGRERERMQELLDGIGKLTQRIEELSTP